MVKTFRKELKDKLSLFIFALVQKNKDDEINNIINGFKLDDFKIENHVKTKLKLKERFAEIISPQEADKIVDESFEFALKTTEKETYQAMESFVHNLNTMHCLPYTEKIWVFDKKENELKLIEIGKLNEDYEVNRFYAISLNKKTFESELKLITQIQKKDNNRKLIKLKTKAGQEVITTDNHQILSLNYNDGRIVDKYPKEITNILSPRNLNLPNANNVINLEQYGKIYKNSKFKNKEITITNELAELLGYYVADGSIVSNSEMSLCVANKVDYSYLIELMKKIFNVDFNYNIYTYDNNKLKEIRFCVGTRIAKMLKDKCGDNAKNKKIPTEIIFNKDNVVTSFINSYLKCDGANRYSYAECSSVSETLIAQLQLLNLKFGELSTIRHDNLINSFNSKLYNLHTLIIGGKSCKRIGIKLERYPSFEIPKYNLAYVRKLEGVKYNYRKSKSLRYEEFNKDSKYQKVFNIDVVEKTELNSGDEYVYDISVQDNENFLTKDCIFVHNSRAGAQVPFSSINFGMDTSEEGRMVSRNLLLAQEAGLGNGETPIFPILIFQVKEGVNYNPGDKNYDLFKLAMRVSAKRLFPNFVFVDAPFNLQYYNPNDPETIIATMGCVDGEEVITYKIGNNMYKESFEDVWNKFVNLFDIRTQGLSQYLELKNITIYDSSSKGFVECKKLIKNPDMNNWRKITFESGKTLLATSNHPLPIILDEKKQRVFVDDILMDSYGFTIKNNELEKDRIIQVEKLGYRNKSSYDVETESDYFDVSGILSHNCRTRVIGNVNGKETPVGRGNLSFTTINLPRLGIKHGYLWRKGKKIEGKIDEYDREQFYTELDSLIDTCILQLLERYEMQKKRHVNNFPFLMGQGVWRGSEKLQRGDELNSVIDTGTLSVGFIGLAECLVGLTGHHHGESEQLQKIGLEIIGHMRERMDEATEKYHLNFSLLGTPAEGLSGFFTRIDKKKYGIIEGITDKEYYTNSFHIPVYYKIGFADKIKKEAPYHALTNAGHITYVEMDGDPTKNLEAFELIVRCMKENGVGYGSINHPVDRDPVCGYSGVIEGNICPKCGRDISKPEIIQEKIKRKHI